MTEELLRPRSTTLESLLPLRSPTYNHVKMSPTPDIARGSFKASDNPKAAGRREEVAPTGCRHEGAARGGGGDSAQ